MEPALSSQAETPNPKDWVGRREESVDLVTAGPIAGLAALLGYETPPWPAGSLPPLAHWFYCLNRTPQDALDGDGHEKRGAFLPLVSLPRRMWAGGSLTFHHQVRLGAVFRRLSTIADVSEKLGRTGPLIFVTLDHRLEDSKGLAILERQELVYRGHAGKISNTVTLHAPPSKSFDWERIVTPDPVLLFRYSALTFNAHRIHYDREFCQGHEGYPGLVVHGPLTATLLADLYLRN
ncbi:MAG: acyl-CoA dehydrogenase, partial [Rhodospirillales bacterium]